MGGWRRSMDGGHQGTLAGWARRCEEDRYKEGNLSPANIAATIPGWPGSTGGQSCFCPAPAVGWRERLCRKSVMAGDRGSGIVAYFQCLLSAYPPVSPIVWEQELGKETSVPLLLSLTEPGSPHSKGRNSSGVSPWLTGRGGQRIGIRRRNPHTTTAAVPCWAQLPTQPQPMARLEQEQVSGSGPAVEVFIDVHPLPFTSSCPEICPRSSLRGAEHLQLRMVSTGPGGIQIF